MVGTWTGYAMGGMPLAVAHRRTFLLFYPFVSIFITVRITEAFGLPKPSLLSGDNYKVMLLLCCLRVN